MPPTIAVPTVCPRLCSSSPPTRDRPLRFFVLPTVHAATTMCAARLLLPTLRPVHFPLFAAPSGFHPHLASASRTLLPPFRCCSCAMSRSAAPCRPPEQPPSRLRPHILEQCPGIELPPTKPSPQEVTKVESTSFTPAVRALHRRPYTSGPADRAMSFAFSPCCSPTTPAPTSVVPPAPHRRSSPLDVRRCGEPFPSLLPLISPPRCQCPPWPLPPLPSTSSSLDFSHRLNGSHHGVRSQVRTRPSW
jgi:hypothetical protein